MPTNRRVSQIDQTNLDFFLWKAASSVLTPEVVLVDVVPGHLLVSGPGVEAPSEAVQLVRLSLRRLHEVLQVMLLRQEDVNSEALVQSRRDRTLCF